MGVIQSTSDQTIRGPEFPSSRRVSTIASEIKQTKLTLKLLVFIFIGAQGSWIEKPKFCWSFYIQEVIVL